MSNIGHYKTSDELRSELAALNLRLAFQEELEDEIATLVDESKTPDPVLQKIIDIADKKVLRHIRRTLAKENIKYAAIVVFPRMCKVFAACLLIFFIGLSTAMATVRSVRIGVLHFLIQIEDKYTSLGFENRGEAIDIPVEWQGYYYPAYIPKGFTYATVDGSTAHYFREESNLMFSEYGRETAVNIDTEEADVKFVDVKGNNALISEKNGWTMLTWAISNRYFLIEIQGSEEEAIKIAESVIMIK